MHPIATKNWTRAKSPYAADNYLQTRRDGWDNEITKDRSMDTPMPAGDMGSFGGRQYAEFQGSAQDTYGVQIPHGTSAAFNTAETMYVDNSRADRGPEYVEGTSDSGITGSRSRPRSDNNNVGDTSVPSVMRTKGK